MYILVNKDIEISKWKLPSQVGHAILRYTTSTKGKEDILLKEYLNLDDNDRKIVTLACPESRMKKLEEEGYPAQRDLGLTELVPDTLTAICYGIVDKSESLDDVKFPKWLKRLRLYK